MKKYAFVGDVGGTNVRLALCNLSTGSITNTKNFLTSNFNSLEIVIRVYLHTQKEKIKNGSIAIACPIKNNWVEMTNHNWAFSIKKMKRNLALHHLEVINDFTAVSMAIPMLSNIDVIQFGGKTAIKNRPIAVYGAGTGLGVAHLIQVNQQWISLPGEGGHVDFAPNNKEEDLILKILRRELGHVSAERLLSGMGLVNLYRAIVKADHRTPMNLQPHDITKRALSNFCTDSKKALSLFCIIMGRFGGNLALTMGTFGGVYIAGGIVPRFLEFFKYSGFRAAFEDKGRFRDYVKNIPVYMIKHDHPGLLGAGAHLRQKLGKIL